VILEEGAGEEGLSISSSESSAMTEALPWRDDSIVDLVAMLSSERCVLKEVSKGLVRLLIIVMLFRLF